MEGRIEPVILDTDLLSTIAGVKREMGGSDDLMLSYDESRSPTEASRWKVNVGL